MILIAEKIILKIKSGLQEILVEWSACPTTKQEVTGSIPALPQF